MYNKCHEFIEVNSSVGQVLTLNPSSKSSKEPPNATFLKKNSSKQFKAFHPNNLIGCIGVFFFFVGHLYVQTYSMEFVTYI